MAFSDWIKDYWHETGRLNRKRIKALILTAPFWVTIAAMGLIAAGSIRIAVLNSQRYDTRMAQVWSQGSETPYRHMAVYARGARAMGETSPFAYIDQDISLKRGDILMIRTTLQSVVDSGNPSQKKKGLSDEGRPIGWEDCFSSTLTDVAAVHDKDINSNPITTDAQIVGVDGNFKAFHPFRYLSGGFLPEVSTDPDQVVINDVLAWRFFNSYDVVGHKIGIGAGTYTVIGVVAEPSAGLDRDAGTDFPRAYIYFSSMEKNYLDSAEVGNDEYGAVAELGIQCYEAMLPELVKKVSITDIKNALPNYNNADPKLYVVSVTDSLKPSKVWDYMMPIGQTAGMLDSYEFPYWEKAQAMTVTRIFIDMIMIAVGIVLMIIGIIMMVLRFRKNTKEQK